MIPVITDALNSTWRPALKQAGIYLRPPISTILLHPDSVASGRAVYLVFGAGQPSPALVLKTSAIVSHQRRLQNAYQTLQDLWRISALQGTVPRPIGLFDVDDHLVLARSAVPGVALDVLVRRGKRVRLSQVQHDLFRAQVWLQLLQEATASGVTAFEGGAAVRDRLALLAHLGRPLDDRLGGFVASLEDAAEAHRGLVLPITGRHGDFRPGHVLIDGNRLGVIGWERAAERATPFDDVFQFVVELADALPVTERRAAVPADAFTRAFLARTSLSALVVEYVDRYLRAMHVPSTAAPVLFPLFLLDRAVAEAGRLSAGETPSSRWWSLFVLYAAHADASVFVPGPDVPGRRAA